MKQKSLKLNFIMNVLLTLSSVIFPIITFPYVSRILTPVGTGKVSFATSLITYFSMFAQLGIPTYGIRACAKVRDNKKELSRTVHELLFINCISSIIAYIVLGIMLIYINRLQEERMLYIIISFSIILTSFGVEWLYKALEQYTYITIRSVIFKFIALVAMFLLIHKPEDYVLYGGITIFAASASNILNLINVHKYIYIKWMRKYNVVRHLKAVIIFFAMACATTIYTNLDTVMLGFMSNDISVGYYNAAVKIKVLLVQVVASLGGVLLPRCSYYIENNMMYDFKRICTKALEFVFVVSIPLVIYFVFFAKIAIYFLSGEAYEGAIVPMQIIMPTVLFIGLTNILGLQILVPLGKEKIVLISEIVGAISDLTLNAILIPKFSASGAAFGTLIAELMVFCVQFYALKEQIIYMLKKIPYIKIIVAAIIPLILLIKIMVLNIGIVLKLIISGGLYFGIYGILLLLLKEDLIIEIYMQLLDKMNIIRGKNDE